MSAVSGQLWHQKEDPDERAKALWQVVTSYQTDQEARRRRILRNLRLYEGRELPDLTPTAYYHSTDYMGAGWTIHRLQLARALVSTARAKIASKQKPKAMFAVSDGDWSMSGSASGTRSALSSMLLSELGQRGQSGGGRSMGGEDDARRMGRIRQNNRTRGARSMPDPTYAYSQGNGFLHN